MKYLVMTMPNGEKWRVPAEMIAKNRAKYYGGKEGSERYKDEYNIILEDDFELMDWASNNMDWDEVKAFAKKVKEADPILEEDFQECWMNGEREIIEDE